MGLSLSLDANHMLFTAHELSYIDSSWEKTINQTLIELYGKFAARIKMNENYLYWWIGFLIFRAYKWF